MRHYNSKNHFRSRIAAIFHILFSLWNKKAVRLFQNGLQTLKSYRNAATEEETEY